ncbi:DUF3857 domain-containing protein [Sphingomonas sp.]|uniref:DUF3857 domain-containing protein n=1 Tax=Sphingomonas sp. TaxID=28214 RepID=UPI001DD43B8E|nr:DUF3857 domain-containing protein [Sphingomonas sp.]MBX9796259.1 DUF3857 domain-containing protein [Sphingomonas sp.]
MRWLVLFAVIAGLGTVARAQAPETVGTGPAPAWVVPVAPGAERPADGAFQLRLADIQVRTDAQGLHSFRHTVVKVLAPAALQPLGNLTVQWQPSFGKVTMHQVTIIRAGTRLDVLKDGKGIQVLRREEGLSSFQLDGRLTAVFSVPDLRLGDTLEFSYTVDQANPLLAGRAEEQLGFAPGVAAERLFLRLSWPTARQVLTRFGEAMPKPARTREGDITALVVDQVDFKVPEVPADSPGRYALRGHVELSEFADWSAVRGNMAPLYQKAAVAAPGSPLRAEIDRIAALSADPVVRASEALTLVQRQVRYFAQIDGLGGYLPEAADAVWAARRGDCKGKTALLVALLRGLGIDAVPALVSTKHSDGVDASLAMPGRFDHVIVRVRLGDKTYWLDGTRLGDRSIGQLAVPDFKWALPLDAADAAPARLVPLPATAPAEPNSEWRLDLDARAGLDKPAKATGTVVFRGELAQIFGTGFESMTSADRETALRKLWSERHDWVTIDSVSFQTDPATGHVRLGFTGSGKMEWTGAEGGAGRLYEANKSRLGMNIAPKRNPGTENAAPVQVGARYDVVQQTILLPDQGKGFTIEGDNVDRVIGGVRYTRTATLKDGRFDFTAATRSQASEIAYADARAADKLTDGLFEQLLQIKAPQAKAAQAKAAPVVVVTREVERRSVPERGTASGLQDENALATQVRAKMEAGEMAAALALVDTRLAQQRTAERLRLRAEVLEADERFDAAGDALDAAIALDEDNDAVLRERAQLLQRAGRDIDALILFDRRVLRNPGDYDIVMDRARARAAAGRYEGAINDLDTALKLKPGDEEAAGRRLDLMIAHGDRQAALREVEQQLADHPGTAWYLARKAQVLLAMGRRDEARKLVAESIAIGPTQLAYWLAIDNLFGDDLNAQGENLLGYIREAPGYTPPLHVLRPLARDPAWRAKIDAAYAAAIEAVPPEQVPGVRHTRAAFQAAGGDTAPLLKLVDEPVAKPRPSPDDLNAACYARAEFGVELDKAQEQCMAAIARLPRPAILDSLGLVQLRRGDFAGAKASYDRAIFNNAGIAVTFFGRGLARLRLGDKAGAEADFAIARRLQPMVAQLFAAMDLKP